MKKINSAIALCGLALCGCSATGATAEEVGLSDAQISSIASFFAAPIKSVATITPRYAAFGGATFTATDEVSSTARHSDLCLTGTRMPLLQSDVTASSEGYVMLNTLGLDNVVDSTEVTDDSNLPIAFAGNYDSGYKALSLINASNFSRYFTVETAEGGYTLKGTDLLTALISPAMSKFLYTINPYSFDYLTSYQLIEDFELTVDSAGTPKQAKFANVLADAYGYMAEDYVVELSAIDAVTPLTPYTSSLDEEDLSRLTATFQKLYEGVQGLNFTTNVKTTLVDGTEVPTHGEYKSYYDLAGKFGGRKLMITDMPLTDASYGTTYTGLAYFTAEAAGKDGYYQIGVTPGTAGSNGYAATLSADAYTLDNGAVPFIQSLSTAFFEKDGEGYVFDLTDFPYLDYTLCFDIMAAVFGVGDYPTRMSGWYVESTTSYAFGFDRLEVSIDEAGYPVFELYFASETFGGDCVTTVSYSDFGTTDITAHNLDGVLDTFDLYLGSYQG